MARGARHSEATYSTFRAHYLMTRNASEAARKTKIPVETGCDWARKLDKDPEFANECKEVRARRADRLEARLERLADKVADRIEADDLVPDELAALATRHELKSFSYQNPKPQYLKGLVDLHKSLSANRRNDTDGVPREPLEVTVKLKGVQYDGRPN